MRVRFCSVLYVLYSGWSGGVGVRGVGVCRLELVVHLECIVLDMRMHNFTRTKALLQFLQD
jgi:hypothetical protein